MDADEIEAEKYHSQFISHPPDKASFEMGFIVGAMHVRSDLAAKDAELLRCQQLHVGAVQLAVSRSLELDAKDAEIERLRRVVSAAKALLDRIDGPPLISAVQSVRRPIDTGSLSDVLVELRRTVRDCE